MKKIHFVFFIIIMGVSSLIAGVYKTTEAIDFLNRTVKTDAIVVDYYRNPYSDSVSPTFSPIFKFTDLNGKEVYQRGATSYSYHLQFEIGTKVEILYDPENPSATVYAGILDLWAAPLIYCLGGLIFIAGATIIYKKRR